MVLKLSGGAARLYGGELVDVTDKDESGALSTGLAEECPGVVGAEHGDLVHHLDLGAVLGVGDGAGGEQSSDGSVLGADRVAEHSRGGRGRGKRANLEPLITCGSGVCGQEGGGLGGAGAALDARHGMGRQEEVAVGDALSLRPAMTVLDQLQNGCADDAGGVGVVGEQRDHAATFSLQREDALLGHDALEGGSCHLFRYTAATLMLEGGAYIRFIRALLGHESLESTQIYPRVAIAKFAEIHAATHAGARLARGCALLDAALADNATTE